MSHHKKHNLRFFSLTAGGGGWWGCGLLIKQLNKSQLNNEAKQMSLEKAKEFFDLSVRRLETRDPGLATGYVITGVPKKESQSEIQYQEISDVYVLVKNPYGHNEN
jgi:hypothetical protein